MLTGSINILASVLEPIKEIGISALLGVSLAILLQIPFHFFKKESNRMCATIGIVFLATALSGYLGASSLLTCMIFGAVLVNISKNSTNVIEISEMMTPPILMLFLFYQVHRLILRLYPKLGLLAGFILL